MFRKYFKIEDKVSLVYPEGENESIIEGVVIKPYYNTFMEFNDPDGLSTKLGTTFYIKKKNELFVERKAKKKIPQTAWPENVEHAKMMFGTYITENRLNNVFSKHGVIESTSDIGKYIKLFMEDAQEEFTKDFKSDIIDLDKKELKYIYNCSKEIVMMLKVKM